MSLFGVTTEFRLPGNQCVSAHREAASGGTVLASFPCNLLSLEASEFFALHAIRRRIRMRLDHLLIAGTALISSAAIAAGTAKHSQALTEQQPEQSAQIAPESQAPAGQDREVIKQAQEKLTSLGHKAGPVDGIAGPKTKAAVKRFQQSNGLQVSGHLDMQTLAALQVGPESQARSMAPSEASSQASASASPSESSTLSSSESPSESTSMSSSAAPSEPSEQSTAPQSAMPDPTSREASLTTTEPASEQSQS
jgi:hypothetical protein